MGRSKGWASVDEDGDKVRADSDVDLVRALLRQRAARDDARVVERLMHLICTDTDRHFHLVLRSWPDPVNWSTAGESCSLVGTGGSVAGWR